MRKKKRLEIGEKLAVFGFGKLQDLVTLWDYLQRDKMTIEDVRSYVEATKEALLQASKRREEMLKKLEEKWKKNTRRCPTCMNPLMLRPIRIPKGKSNQEGYTCHWFCQQEDCDFEGYTHEDFKEVYQKIMGEGGR